MIHFDTNVYYILNVLLLLIYYFLIPKIWFAEDEEVERVEAAELVTTKLVEDT